MSRAIMRPTLFLALVGLVALADPRSTPTKIRPMPNTDSATWCDEPRGRWTEEHVNGRDPREDPVRGARSRAPSREPRPDAPAACTRPTGR